jgi:hypothetical protein
MQLSKEEADIIASLILSSTMDINGHKVSISDIVNLFNKLKGYATSKEIK